MVSHRIGFTAQERSRARRYHRPRRVALLLDLALAVAVLAGLTLVSLPGPWWAAALGTPALVAVVLTAARAPVAWWRYRHDVRWALATQAPRGWAADVLKELVVETTLLVAALFPLFALARVDPHAWAGPAAAGAALLVLTLGLLAPVLLEPVFNRFEPLADDELARRLHAVASRAETPVREILVADASRRTTRANAYVSGIGRTRRVVLWDTLLRAPPEEIAVVLAHELGHRTRRHVAILTALSMAGAAAFVLALSLLRRTPTPRDTAFIVLAAVVAQLAALPALSALSRSFERSADRFSLEVTSDREAFRALQRRLALENLAELEPPIWLHAWFGTHPTPPQRLEDA